MTEYLISIAFKIVWGSVGLFWLWSARNVKRSSRTEPALLQLFVYWTPLVVAFVLLGPGDWFEGSFLRERFVPRALWVKGFDLVLATFGAAWLAGRGIFLDATGAVSSSSSTIMSLSTSGPIATFATPST